MSLKLYQTDLSVCHLSVKPDAVLTSSKEEVNTIVILDISGSMGANVNRIVTAYLPLALMKLGIIEIDLITFTDRAETTHFRTADLSKSTLSSRGSTYMGGAVSQLAALISAKSGSFRILTISDGEISDQAETASLSTRLASAIRSRQIQSTAIRFFTSYSQPDTRALSSVMQFDTVGSGCKLVDVSAHQDQSLIVKTFYDCLNGNLTTAYATLTADSPCIQSVPWADTAVKSLKVRPGTTVFWLNTPSTNLYLDGKPLIPEVVPMTTKNYMEALTPKISEFTDYLKIRKVVSGSSLDSDSDATKIIKYFTDLERTLELADPDTNLNEHRGLQSRIKVLLNKKIRSVSQRLSEIANDSRVSKMNSAQQADYLRSAQTSTNAINLAKIAEKNGFNFDDRAHKEAREMAKHLSELDDIDYATHEVSFYSQSTTVEGIKTVASLTADPSFEQMSALDILLLLNIVGVPCVGQVGEFPDPKTYHSSKLFTGTRVSMSDVITVSSLAGGVESSELHDPFSKERIWNVVPTYDDDRVQKFLMKYAPTLLEYTASLGMRRMVLEVAHTYKYTVVSGLWYVVRAFQQTPTEGLAKLLIDLTRTYKTAVNGLFDHTVSLIVPPRNNMSYFIGNNGITNMISPLITLCESGKTEYIPNILRALYAFEFNQVVRKYHRSDSDGHIQRKAMLRRVLGVDTAKYGSSLPPLYTAQPCPKHCNEYFIENDEFDRIVKQVHWIDSLPLMPELFKVILGSGKTTSEMVPALILAVQTAQQHETYLGITYDLRTFKMFCIFQAFVYDTREARVNDDTKSMKFLDAGDMGAIDSEVRTWIRAQYHSDYQVRLAEQNKKELENLTKDMVEELCSCTNIEHFNTLLRDGVKREDTHVQFTSSFSQGVADFRAKLFDPAVRVELRADKIKVFLLGIDSNGSLVWNKGNVYKMSYEVLASSMTALGLSTALSSYLDDYKARALYIYRESDKPNRHTHCNHKPSYWAYGYKTLGDYINNISADDLEEYCKVHTHCCGVWDGKPVRLA